MTESNFYQEISHEAAKAERSGQLKQAACLWMNCSSAAYSARNRMFAEHRAEFCIKQLQRLTEVEMQNA